MSEKTHLFIFGGNLFLFLNGFEQYLRIGTQILAFSAAALSLTLLIYKERHVLRVIIKGGEKQGATKAENGDERGPNTPNNSL